MKKPLLIILILSALNTYAALVPYHPCLISCARTHGPMEPRPKDKVDVIDAFLIFIGL